MSWLVTGGAGYIGSHVTHAMCDAGIPVVVIDDLSTGFAEFVAPAATFVEGSLLDGALVEDTLRRNGVRGVIHVAGYKYAGESVNRPLHTYEQNVTATLTLLSAMQRAGVEAIVFSSSAATYGTPDVEVVDESTATTPESPYGETKLIGEWLLRDVGRSAGIRHTSLRYFNVVGSGSPRLFDASPHNLFPKVFDMLYRGETPRVNGDDYPTPDGTCVRDYIHVADLALAHVAAARRLDDGLPVERVYNLGSGAGTSVAQIMTAIRTVTGIDFEPTIMPRRPGDPARIVATGDLAARDLDWTMRHSLEEMVSSAWEARRQAGDTYPR
ncbi:MULTISPECIES: UDP-glucose 4-epimerase GalE [Mycobacteriaceae]|uniref:UDP-glucose 4-epimerase GalE n=1 Tax=Mycolicibacterium parafortuitum TaxID=39692 RepID=A0ACC6MAJ8_MYCPF|nr:MULTISPECIES: UDP-glucose 4-epimerase GalE [Mycobacteriaceae]MBX7449511.1 UDP-glucose 4-epimerase GalE [Mycolicibacterium aurantiacum]MEC9323664.1 UDP-glucose 4-epimerase GalE [Actinomycetota bacterium]MDZ5083942.1 UDP-glucose 4-epimerase GalE [Mycolicibacterium parafortuitum]GFM20005.1 UDP-glucose 4-epimerase [Mycobacterium sp. PO1]GFM26121.1 UDP-glucose 4-epimerase [Mycobacterium sp. PO2]